jgi:hypothetical protein
MSVQRSLSPLTVDHFLVIIDECVALPMRGAQQLATGISWRFEASEKAIGIQAGPTEASASSKNNHNSNGSGKRRLAHRRSDNPQLTSALPICCQLLPHSLIGACPSAHDACAHNAGMDSHRPRRVNGP